MLRLGLRIALLVVLVPAFVLSSRRIVARGDQLAICRRASRWCRWGVRILGLRVDHTTPPLRDGVPRLIVANHISWIDPLLFAARAPALFVTSLEVSSDALLGRVCAAAGCLFVDRRRHSGARDARDRIAHALNSIDVVVFPEATSSDGTSVLPFKPAAFAAACADGRIVHPVAIVHRSWDDRPLARQLRDRVCWYGDMRFLPHLFGIVRARHVRSRLHWLSIVQGADRKLLAQQSRRMIVADLASAYDAFGFQPARGGEKGVPRKGEVLPKGNHGQGIEQQLGAAGSVQVATVGTHDR